MFPIKGKNVWLTGWVSVGENILGWEMCLLLKWITRDIYPTENTGLLTLENWLAGCNCLNYCCEVVRAPWDLLIKNRDHLHNSGINCKSMQCFWYMDGQITVTKTQTVTTMRQSNYHISSKSVKQSRPERACSGNVYFSNQSHKRFGPMIWLRHVLMESSNNFLTILTISGSHTNLE